VIAETARLIAQLLLDDRMSGGLKRAGTNLGRFEGSVGRVGKGLGQMQTGAVRAGTKIAAGVALAGVGMAKVAIDFESAFAGIRKTVSQSDLDKAGITFDQLHDAILNMSTVIPVAATDLAAIGEEAGALGIRAQDITSFTEVVAKLAVTTNLTTDTAAESLGHLGTILGLTGKDFENFADTLVNLGNKGAATESDIIGVAERFAGAGKQAGLTTNQILGMSNALASLRAGGNIEASGGAMSRTFSNIATNVALGSAKGKAFGKILGESIGSLRKQINNRQGLPMFLKFLDKLKAMTPVQQAKALEQIGITATRDRDAITKLAQRTDVLRQSLKDAADSQGALDREAQTRFNTIASQLGLLKNSLIRLGIEAGEGMLPGIKKATDSLRKLLNDPKFIDQAKAIGKNLGDALESINWAEVLDTAKGLSDALKPALDIALRIANAFNALPTEVKGATIGLVALNKLSGGLLGEGFGNVLGGLGGGAIKGALSRAPGIGGLVATPVRVVNWPVGGLGGAAGGVGGAAGGSSRLAKAGAALSVVGDIAAVVAVQQEISSENTATGKALEAQLASGIAVKTPAELATSLAAVNKGINDLQANPLNVLVQGSALDSLKAMRTSLQNQIDAKVPKTNVFHGGLGSAVAGAVTKAIPVLKVPGLEAKLDRNIDRLGHLQSALHRAKESGDNQRIANLRGRIETTNTRISEAKAGITAAQQATRDAAVVAGFKTTDAGIAITAAVNAAAASMVSAIFAARPVIQTTNITTNTTVSERYGPTSGSSGRPEHPQSDNGGGP